MEGNNMKDFNNMNRNYNRIQFENLRRVIDHKYNQVHDELSDCYYNKKSFRTYGILNKETFDKLHGLIFLERDIEFHSENMKRPENEKYPEEQYNNIVDEKTHEVIGKRTDKTVQKIQSLKDAGLELNIAIKKIE